MPHGKRADRAHRNPGVAASRQSAANCNGNSNGGFLPKAATPKADGAHPQTGRVVSALCADGGRPQGPSHRLDATTAFRIPQGQRTLFLNPFWDGRLGGKAVETREASWSAAAVTPLWEGVRLRAKAVSRSACHRSPRRQALFVSGTGRIGRALQSRIPNSAGAICRADSSRRSFAKTEIR
jgi:hypothetical protein